MTRQAISGAFLLALASACAGGNGPSALDAGSQPSASDSGTWVDSGTAISTDSGSPGGSGNGIDAGVPPSDGGPLTDSGTLVPPITLTEDGGVVTMSNGLVTIEFNETTGLSNYIFQGTTYVSGAYASVDLGAPAGYVTTRGYPTHAFSMGSVTPLDDGWGHGVRVPIDSTSPGKPTVRQIFSVYEGQPYFFVEENVLSASAASIASNYLGAIIVDAQSGWVAAPSGPDQRFLDVPFDNDEWVRYDSRVFGAADFAGTGYEVAAVYDSASRHGLVLGSVTHDFWKTGVYYDFDSAHHRLRGLNVWGGAATPDVTSSSGPTYGKDGTHDVAKHGSMLGTTLTSPRIFVGYFDDYRSGLEAFGRANAVVAPPKPWSAPKGSTGVAFGWNSWGAYGLGVTAARVTAASDFLAANLQPRGFANGGVYINIDAGLGTDPTPLVQHIHANGQKAGTYLVPFSYFYSKSDPAPLSRLVLSGSSWTYNDVVLRDDSGTPIQHNGAYALDPTHPGTRAMMAAQAKRVVDQGFDYVKLDFLTNGALEGQHSDPTVRSGIQAYNQAMAYLTGLLPPNIFVSLSIAPLFPSQYGHARRISCDVLSQLNDLMEPAYPHYGSTEYMLNSLTYGWWMNGTLYDYNDPDAMSLVRFENTANDIPQAWARTRVTASAIAGTVFLDTTDYSNPTGAARALAYLTQPGVNQMARRGRSFRPMEGNTERVTAPIPGSASTNSGSAATDVFVSDNGDGTFAIAAFNYDQTNVSTKNIDLSRAGLSATGSYTVADAWSGAGLGSATGSILVTLQPGEAKLVTLSP